MNNLRETEAFPQALAALLALIGLLAIVHALVSTARFRRHDLVVLRALGFQRRQLASTVAWQATTIAAAGLAVGVPLGVGLGRGIWRALASSMGVVDDPLLPALAFLVLISIVLVAANLAAAVPGRTAARVPVAAVLRTE